MGMKILNQPRLSFVHGWVIVYKETVDVVNHSNTRRFVSYGLYNPSVPTMLWVSLGYIRRMMQLSNVSRAVDYLLLSIGCWYMYCWEPLSPLRHAMQQQVLPTCGNMKLVAFWWDSTPPHTQCKESKIDFFLFQWIQVMIKRSKFAHTCRASTYLTTVFVCLWINMTKIFIKWGKLNSAIDFWWPPQLTNILNTIIIRHEYFVIYNSFFQKVTLISVQQIQMVCATCG